MSDREQVPRLTETLFGKAVSLVCGLDGQVRADERHGLFAADTRVLSTYRLAIEGAPWTLLGRSHLGNAVAQWDYQNPSVRGPLGPPLEAATLHLRLRRTLDHALTDELVLTSFARARVGVRIMLQLDADFADLFEVKNGSVRPRLGVRRTAHGAGVDLTYEHEGFRRALRLAIRGPVPATQGGALLLFDVALAPGERVAWSVVATPVVDEDALFEHELPKARFVPPKGGARLDAPPLLQGPFDRACEDLHDLSVPQEGAPPFVAAGVPWFHTLFGRDSLLTGLLGGLAGAWPSWGALSALARRQANARDDFRDAEPGKLPHEIRRGEAAYRRETPHAAYYGTHDAPALFCLALWNAWRWTGDEAQLHAHLEPARAALRWCDELGDRDQDGFLEYATRSPVGYRNQGWQDAEEAIFDARGVQAEPPVAPVELQGYWFAARLAMAEIAAALGDEVTAGRLEQAARDLRRRVEARFWMNDEAYYAVALDGDKRVMGSLTSNPGHLLWCGLPSAARAGAVATRMLRPDLFSGWGLRTLSSHNPAFDPLAYQRGSVWPHDTLLAAAGLFRFGLREEGSALIRAVLDAAATCEDDRLPELFCGFDRAQGLPVPWERANSPQAWAAAAVLLAVQLFLGLLPDAPRHRCFVSPWLPPWLPRLEVRGLVIGTEELTVRLTRGEDGDILLDRTGGPGLEVIRGVGPGALWGAPP